jgi:hypothetical protein
MNTLLWILQAALAVFVAFTGLIHFTVPPELPAPLRWMYALPAPVHYLAGTAEVLAAVGLILPGLARVRTGLTPLAAVALGVVMLGAIVFHVARGEALNVVINAAVLAAAALVAYGRWRVNPLPDRPVREVGARA